MKKIYIISSLVIFVAAVFIYQYMGFRDQPLTTELYSTGLKIVDIRTAEEWKQTGIVKGSYPISLYDKKGKCDFERFISDVKIVMKTSEPFAVICKAGIMSSIASSILEKAGFRKVISIEGGIIEAEKNNIPFESYAKES